jgi:GxxExxY protein
VIANGPAADDNQLSGEVIGAAIEVHRELGPGLLESIYREALATELTARGFVVHREVEVPIRYKGKILTNSLRLDMLVNELMVVEVKSIERIIAVHEAQLLSYLRLSHRRLGLLINFNSPVLTRSIRRIVNGYIANTDTDDHGR